MSRMDIQAVLEVTKIGSRSALWSRIDVGEFPHPVAMSEGGHYWDSGAVRQAIEIIRAPWPDEPLPREKPQPRPPASTREKPQPPARTRERKDDARSETRESE